MTIKTLVVAGAAAVLAAASSASEAHGHHGHHGRHGGHFGLGIVIGAPFVHWPYYPPYPPTVVVREEPKVYIEKSEARDAAPAPPAAGQWYYCRSSDMYYPYTKHCPGGWDRVPAEPPR